MSGDQAIPVVRLELERMKHTILAAFVGHLDDLKVGVREAVDAACTPERVRGVIAQAVERELRQAVDREVMTFFRYGAGVEVVREAVNRQLSAAVAEQVRRDQWLAEAESDYSAERTDKEG